MKKAAKKAVNKILAGILSFAVLLSGCLPLISVAAANDTVTIRSEADFSAFAKQCKTDTWSKSKTVLLESDLDLSKAEISVVPTFGGTFDGNGHTISGLELKQKGSYAGLFRYLQQDGVIKNLNVSGTVAPEGSKKYVGGIVGENSGTIMDSKFAGTVTGEANVGGICGYVTETGTVSGCSFSGSVTGKSYTGGICGQNYGIVKNCANNGSINTTDTETEKSIQDLDLDLEEIGTTESIDTATDTGGICGFSKGKIIGCENYGNVGYQSVGYNTGGICGRQAGTIAESTNYGVINGRKDIGGICGQAEPYILLEYTKDVLNQMDDVLSRVQAIIDENTSDNALSDSFDNISGSITDLTDSANVISDDAKEYADGISGAVNDLSDRIHTALDDSSAVFDAITAGTDQLSAGVSHFEKSGDYIKNILADIEKAEQAADGSGNHLDSASAYLQRAIGRISDACDELEDSISSLNAGSRKLQSAVRALSKALAEKKNIEANFKEIWSCLGEIQESLSKIGNSLEDVAKVLAELKEKGYIKTAIGETIDNMIALADCYKDIGNALTGIRDACLIMAEDFDIYSISSAFRILSRGFDSLGSAIHALRLAGDDLKVALDTLDGTTENFSGFVSELQEGLKQISKGADSLSDSITKLSEITDTLTKDGSIKMPSASDVFGNDFDDLFDTVRNMQTQFTDLKDVLKNKENELSGKFDRLEKELNAFVDILSGAYDDHMNADETGFVEDVSDADYTGDMRGKIETSRNLGEVFGDVNVGGVVGSMAIEYDFDPEDDIKNSGDQSLKFTYKTKCVVRRCKNEAEVTAKKNYGGGVTGRMDLGSVLSCENYGKISTTDGDYTGGIAGLSETVIRNSVSKCDLAGKDYVGGIAGKGNTISNCYTLVNITEYGECAGTIAGTADQAELQHNYFVGDTLGAIDDINYTNLAAKAEIADFAEFVKAEFGTDVGFTLVFVADDKEVGRLDFEYKQPIAKEQIPKVPDKKGYYGKWSKYDYANPSFDAVITAEYYRDIDLIESEAKRENGKSVVLLCGAFDDSARVTATKNEKYSKALGRKKVIDSFAVDTDGVYAETLKVRYLPLTENKKADLFVETDGKVEKISAKQFGSYLEFETAGSSFTIYEVKKDYTGIIVLSVILAAGAGYAVFLLLRCRKKKRKLPDSSSVEEKA